jgi:hypothetical protein
MYFENSIQEVGKKLPLGSKETMITKKETVFIKQSFFYAATSVQNFGFFTVSIR